MSPHPRVLSDDFLTLVSARRGHFRMESGLHSGLWLDLDGLFCAPSAVAPLIDDLAARIRRHRVEAVCGPSLGGAFLAQRLAMLLDVPFWFSRKEASVGTTGLFQARYSLPAAVHRAAYGVRVGVVDDVMSAGSSLRATVAALRGAGATPTVIGALCVMGDVGESHFRGEGLPVETSVRLPLEVWAPGACPLCSSALPLEVVG